jgi:hypothetical protein
MWIVGGEGELRRMSVHMKVNFNYTSKKREGFIWPVFLKFTNKLQHYVYIPCSKYHSIWTMSVESMH